VNLIDRLDLACNHANIQNKDIAESLGIHKSTMAAIKKGRMQFAPYAARIAEILNVPQEWLEHGTGPAPAWFTQPDSILPATDQIAVLTQNVTTLMTMMADMQKTLEELKTKAKPKAPFRPSARPHLKAQLGQPDNDRLTKPTPIHEA
jgi:transcriptional regulator with XRE-family HTH domain